MNIFTNEDGLMIGIPEEKLIDTGGYLTVAEISSDLDVRDLYWLRDQLEIVEKDLDDNIDNWRLCKVTENGEMTIEYETIRDDGCCGFEDRLITSPKTGQSYWLGCNYGH